MPVFSLPYAIDEKTVAILGDSGIILGLEDVEGCRWRWESNDPWSPSPPVRAVTGDRATAHGSWDATRFYGPRNPQFKGTVVAPTHAALHAAKQRLFDAVSVEPFDLRVIEPGFDRVATVRREGDVLWTEMRNTIAATYSLSLFAPDPVVRSSESHEVSGPTFPLLDLNNPDAQVQVSNGGGMASAPIITVTGPTGEDVSVWNRTTGRTLNVTNPEFGRVVDEGQTLVIDMQRRTITLDGVNVRGWMTGSWWELPPGASTLWFGYLSPLLGPTSDGHVTVTWRKGWI